MLFLITPDIVFSKLAIDKKNVGIYATSYLDNTGL